MRTTPTFKVSRFFGLRFESELSIVSNHRLRKQSFRFFLAFSNFFSSILNDVIIQTDADWPMRQSSILICSRGKVPPAHTGHHFYQSIDEDF